MQYPRKFINCLSTATYITGLYSIDKIRLNFCLHSVAVNLSTGQFYHRWMMIVRFQKMYSPLLRQLIRMIIQTIVAEFLHPQLPIEIVHNYLSKY